MTVAREFLPGCRISADVAFIRVPAGPIQLRPAFGNFPVHFILFFFVAQNTFTTAVGCIVFRICVSGNGPPRTVEFFNFVVRFLTCGVRRFAEFLERNFGCSSFHCAFHVFFFDAELFRDVFASQTVAAFFEIFTV